jgi:hypothetical protein
VPDSDLLRAVVDAISDGANINWAAAEGAATPGEQALLQQLKAIAGLTGAERTTADAGEQVGSRGLTTLYHLLLTIAAGKTLVGFAAWLIAVVDVNAGLPPWPYIANVAVFGLAAAFLWWGGRDWRARALGAFYLLIAAAFSDRLLQVSGHASLDPLIHLLRRLSVDACIPLALWLFVWFFPAPPLGPRDRSLMRVFLTLSFVAGGILVAANAILWIAESFPDIAGGALLTRLVALASPFDRHARGHVFPLLQFLPAAPALPYLLWKSRFEALDERRRAALFSTLLVVGIAPMILAVIVSPFIRFFDDPTNRETVGVFLYAALFSVVPLTAYAVVVQRVLDVQLLLTNALRRALGRYLAILVVASSLIAFVVYVYQHRQLTVSEIVWTPTTATFLTGSAVALLIASFRRQMLQVVDRHLLGAPPAYPEVLQRLERGLRDARGVREVATVLTREADRAVHPRMAAMLVVDERTRRLTPLAGTIPPLDVDSTLGQLLRLARDEIYTGVDAAGPVGRLLPDVDRQWLVDGGVQLLVPMLASAGDLLGVLIVGEKRNGKRFTNDDRLLLATIAGQAAVVFENRALRDWAFQYLPQRQSHHGAIQWDDEPGAICPNCHTMWPAQTTTCRCGQATRPADLPLTIRGMFRVERLLGAGGMSVVYLATDLALDRKAAIKTLPQVIPERAMRLQREARAMAAVRHPNLAMIFGVESWRGAPLLVTEYVEGGTLADRLRRGPLPWEDTIELGIVLADVLDQVHASGVLHRDIKPTNVGFTREGVPKLLDFGIAFMREASVSATAEVEPPSHDLRERATTLQMLSITHADHVVGTPLYISPEGLAGAEPTPSLDLWGLGVLLVEAVTGHHPFAAPTTSEVFERIRRAAIDQHQFQADCPPPLVAFFVRVLAPDPARRPRSAAELRNWLRQLRSETRPA